MLKCTFLRSLSKLIRRNDLEFYILCPAVFSSIVTDKIYFIVNIYYLQIKLTSNSSFQGCIVMSLLFL